MVLRFGTLIFYLSGVFSFQQPLTSFPLNSHALSEYMIRISLSYTLTICFSRLNEWFRWLEQDGLSNILPLCTRGGANGTGICEEKLRVCSKANTSLHPCFNSQQNDCCAPLWRYCLSIAFSLIDNKTGERSPQWAWSYTEASALQFCYSLLFFTTTWDFKAHCGETLLAPAAEP